MDHTEEPGYNPNDPEIEPYNTLNFKKPARVPLWTKFWFWLFLIGVIVLLILG